MKTILALALTLFTAQSFANSISLKKAAPSTPRDNTEVGKIWEDCINQAQEISYASGYAYLKNSNSQCMRLGLEVIPFRQDGRSYIMDLPQDVNPFAKLKNAKVTLTDFHRPDISKLRLSASHRFVSILFLDIRLSMTKDGYKQDYLYSSRESVEGWEKTNQVLISTEERYEECRPRMTCRYVVNNYEQKWKQNRTGQVVKMNIAEVQ